MKKLILMGLIISTLLLCFTACGDNKNDTPNSDFNTTQSNNTSSKDETTTDSKMEEWGVAESRITEKNGTTANAYIKFPYLLGINSGQGKVAYQDDGSLVLFSSETNVNEPIVKSDKAEDIFPAYFDKMIGIVDEYRRADHKDFSFEIDDKENVNINGYEMCKYKGTHTFIVSGEERTIAYVAYGTRIKTNNAAVFWMVLDDTQEQSLGKIIEEHADKMAKTLYDEE